MLRRRPWLWAVLVLLLAAATAGVGNLYQTAVLGSGFMAQSLCSGFFVSNRGPDGLIHEDMSGPGYQLLVFFQADIDRAAKRVTASMFGLGRRTAIYREGLGCTLLADKTETELRAEAADVFPIPTTTADTGSLWPEGERADTEKLPPEINHAKLQAAIEAAFAER